MFGWGTQLKKFAVKLGKLAGVELRYWSSGFESLEELSNLSKQHMMTELTRALQAESDEKKIVALVSALYCVFNQITFTEEEKQKIFFATTRFYESDSRRIRRLTHLLITQLNMGPDLGFMLNACLAKDITSDDVWVQANALKVLFTVFNDVRESELKKALVSGKNYLIYTTLMCCIKIAVENPSSQDTIRKSYYQIMKLIEDNDNSIISTTAIVLLGVVYYEDKQQLYKILTSMSFNDDLKILRVIFLMKQLIISSKDQNVQQKAISFITNILNKNHSMMVQLEAAKSLVDIAKKLKSSSYQQKYYFSMDSLQLKTAVKSLVFMLEDNFEIIRYGSLKKILDMCSIDKKIVKSFSNYIECCISDVSINIIICALMILLKCDPQCDKKFMLQQVQSRMCELTQNQRIELIKSLCSSNFSDKPTVSFLISQVKEDDGYRSKLYIGIKLCEICENLENTTDAMLEYSIEALCELIEDCCNSLLLAYLMCFLTVHIPLIKDPISKVRFIANRINLESESIRMVAVDSFYNIAKKVPALKKDILVLIKNKTVLDFDDEIRYISHVYSSYLEKEDNLSNKFDDIESTECEDSDFNYELNITQDSIDYNYDLVISDTKNLLATQGDYINLDDQIYYDRTPNNSLNDSNNQLMNEKKYEDANSVDKTEAIAIKEMIELFSDIAQIEEVQYSTEYKLLSLIGAEIEIKSRLHHCWTSGGILIIEFHVFNNLSYVELQNLRIEFSHDYNFIFEILSSTKCFKLESDQSAELYTLLKLKSTENTLQDIFKIQKLDIVFHYDCLELGATKNYSDYQELDSLNIDSDAFFAPATMSTTYSNSEYLQMIKLKCKEHFHKQSQVLEIIKKNFNFFYEDDTKIANKMWFSGKLTLEKSKFHGYIHCVNSKEGILLQCCVDNTNEILLNFLNQKLHLLLC